MSHKGHKSHNSHKGPPSCHGRTHWPWREGNEGAGGWGFCGSCGLCGFSKRFDFNWRLSNNILYILLLTFWANGQLSQHARPLIFAHLSIGFCWFLHFLLLCLGCCYESFLDWFSTNLWIQHRSKINKNSIKKLSNIRSTCWCLLKSNFDRFGKPSWRQNGT